jgi:hypothetical protein
MPWEALTKIRQPTPKIFNILLGATRGLTALGSLTKDGPAIRKEIL